MRRPFRQGLLFDLMVHGEWWSSRDLAKAMGATLGSISHCLCLMHQNGTLETNRKTRVMCRYRIVKGAERPKDKRGEEKGKKRSRKGCAYDGTLGHNYERIELEKCWPSFPYGMDTRKMIDTIAGGGSLGTPVGNAND